jgi:hypothetical protein
MPSIPGVNMFVNSQFNMFKRDMGGKDDKGMPMEAMHPYPMFDPMSPFIPGYGHSPIPPGSYMGSVPFP